MTQRLPEKILRRHNGYREKNSAQCKNNVTGQN